MNVTNKLVTDGLQLALLTNRLEGVVRKMANTLLRSGRSGVLNVARDFSCCIVTAESQLLAAADSLPIHVLAGPDLMSASMKDLHPDLKRGDAFLNNSPYHGCSHAADHTILVPVIDGQATHQFTLVVKAHQADCGNSQPTTYMGAARDVYEEGALIFPVVKVQQNYRDVADVIRMCRMRIRVPGQWWGDYLSMIGAARIGEREILQLAEELGWETLQTYARDYLDYSEQRMTSAIRSMAGGCATSYSVHDPLFPGMPEDGVRITAHLKVDPDNAKIIVDLRDNPDALPCGLNLSEACSRTAAMVGIFNSVGPSVPKNSGSFRRLEILLRENCVAGIPLHPTSCSVATTNVADRVANAVQTAFAELEDGAGLAECGAVLPPSVGVVSGIDPRNGHPYVNQLFLGFSGGAGAPNADAWQTIGHVGNAGLCYQDSVELDELKHPIIVHRRTFVPDSEGAGRHSGARSVCVEFGPHGSEFQIGYVSDGSVNPARGVRGGLTGAGSRQYKRLRNGELIELPQGGVITIENGARVVSYSCGGGGYGLPAERDVSLVRQDVLEGYVSNERALEVYKVGIRTDGGVDVEKTALLRDGVQR